VVLARLGHDDLRAFARALKISGVRGPLEHSLQLALGAGRDTTLRDVMRFCAARDPLAREYARNFEVTRELARPALLAALSRADSARGALVQAYLEVLSEVPDVDIAERAGQREAEDVSRMARGVLKAGGVRSRRGLEGVANLDGILRENPRRPHGHRAARDRRGLPDSPGVRPRGPELPPEARLRGPVKPFPERALAALLESRASGPRERGVV